MKTALYLSTFLAGIAAASLAYAADGVVSATPKSGRPDTVHAKPMPLPMAPRGGSGFAKAATKLPALGPAGVEPGAVGNGRMMPVYGPAPQPPPPTTGSPRSSQQYGTSNHPFTTSRADGSGFRVTSAYPWRAAGKLFFRDGGSSYVCSASLIKRGVVVTAAHCVTQFGSGAGNFFTSFEFHPAYTNGTSPYGVWTARRVFVMSSYANGSDSCASGASGVVCQNDVAVIVLNTQSSAYPGSSTGYFGYGFDGFNFTGGYTHVTQLGYPVALDSGGLMERTDSQGYTDTSLVYNTVIGSRQTGGSSGGPWLANFGIMPTTTSGYAEGAVGTAANANIVIGVTSWGYNDNGLLKEQGASPFLTSNIRSLVNSACTLFASACK